MNPPGERRFPRLPLAKADAGASPGAAAFLEDLIDACVMESTFRDHMGGARPALPRHRGPAPRRLRPRGQRRQAARLPHPPPPDAQRPQPPHSQPPPPPHRRQPRPPRHHQTGGPRLKPTNTPAGFADMFATVDAAAAVESAFAALDTALFTEASVLNTAGGEAFQRRLTVEARKCLNAAGASAKLRERIRRLHAERAPAAAEQEPSLGSFSIGPAPLSPAVSQKPVRTEVSPLPAARLTVPRAALLAAALPVLRGPSRRGHV
jgi:hypothetical protein